MKIKSRWNCGVKPIAPREYEGKRVKKSWQTVTEQIKEGRKETMRRSICLTCEKPECRHGDCEAVGGKKRKWS